MRATARILVMLFAAIAGCSTGPRGEIVIAGERHGVDAPVVLWTDGGGYDAHALTNRFSEEPGEPRSRYDARTPRSPAIASLVAREGWSGQAIREQVDQFVVHYDAAGTSRSCFRVLHDLRGLSVHFMLDLDGTIYQTLDVRHRGWHATKANHRSVGIEIANIGAYPPGDRAVLDEWYRVDMLGRAVVSLPAWVGDGGVRAPGFVARPARPSVVREVMQGQIYEMYDLTDEQYASLIALATALCRALPEIEADAPRDARGRVLTGVLSDDAFDEFSGILGHLHVQTNKIDPGPAFDWERVLGGVRANLEHDRGLAAR